MTFIADALGGWLVGQVASAGRKRLGDWLLGSEQERALQQAATAAIQATAEQFRPEWAVADDAQSADHLARVIDHVFEKPPTPAESLTGHPTLLEGLQAGVAARLAALGVVCLTGTGESSAQVLGISVPVLAEQLTQQLLRELVARGASGGPLAPLSDQLNHDLTHLQGQQHSAGLARLAMDLQLATLHQLEPQDHPELARTTLRLGRPVHELTDPFALEVHRAIDTSDRTTPLPDLPIYVERDHDRRLQAIVKQAAEGHSAAAVLVGGSSTGKTRACWEAVQTLPDDWRLWHPIDPSRPEAAADALPAVKPRTIIWLNEAQHYLLTAASELGERVAAGLRELLRDPTRAPVLVLGTIWPEYWATLTTPPSPGQQHDPQAQARALLTGTDIAVPDAFTGPALQALGAAAQADSRLAEAAAHAEHGHITQFLAGGPALLERYRNAPTAAKALIEAAMDARRLGHGLYLPHSLLEAAASGYLTDEQWDGLREDWLEQALAYCAQPCRGARGPLTRVRPRPGQPPLPQPHYRLADYLEQTGRATRRTILAPSALWDALLEHADRDLLRIAEEAERRSLYGHAFLLYQRAAAAGESVAKRQIGMLLGQAGHFDAAIGVLQACAEAGDRDALRPAAALLERTDRIDEAVAWLKTRGEAGEAFAFRQAARLLERSGRVDEAMGLYRRAAEAGDRDALGHTARLLEGAGRIDEALGLYWRAAESGDHGALALAAQVLERADRVDEAVALYQRAAEAGLRDALPLAAWLLERAGRIDEAVGLLLMWSEAGDRPDLEGAAGLLQRADSIVELIDWLQIHAEFDDSAVALRARELLQDAGPIDEVVVLYRRAVEAGDRDALGRAARLLEQLDRVDEAIDLYRLAADADDAVALRQEARLLERSGRVDEAIGLHRRAAEAGDRDALGHAARLLEETDRANEAVAWLLTRTDVGEVAALSQAARLLERSGRVEEAMGLYRRATEAGDRDALGHAARLLERADRVDEAVGLYLRAAQADHDAVRWAGWLLERTDRVDEAVGLYVRAAEAGDRDALGHAARLLEETDRVDEAVGLYLRAAEAGDHDALRHAAWLLEETDRVDAAMRLRQYGLEPGGHIANDWHSSGPFG